MRLYLLVALALTTGGCLKPYDRSQVGFWDQCVKATGYGFSMVTMYGPFNLGAMTWERNINCGKDIKQANPADAILGEIVKGGSPVKVDSAILEKLVK